VQVASDSSTTVVHIELMRAVHVADADENSEGGNGDSNDWVGDDSAFPWKRVWH